MFPFTARQRQRSAISAVLAGTCDARRGIVASQGETEYVARRHSYMRVTVSILPGLLAKNSQPRKKISLCLLPLPHSGQRGR